MVETLRKGVFSVTGASLALANGGGRLLSDASNHSPRLSSIVPEPGA